MRSFMKRCHFGEGEGGRGGHSIYSSTTGTVLTLLTRKKIIFLWYNFFWYDFFLGKIQLLENFVSSPSGNFYVELNKMFNKNSFHVFSDVFPTKCLFFFFCHLPTHLDFFFPVEQNYSLKNSPIHHQSRLYFMIKHDFFLTKYSI